MSGMKYPPSKTQYFPLVGGLDAESAQLTLTPGAMLGALNYESSALDGYERIGGFERFDGRPRPSDAVYKLMQSASAFTGVVAGNTVNGATSGATGKVVLVRGTNQIVITKSTGTWAYGENIRVGTTVVGVYTQDGSDIDGFDENGFMALAAADYRADIGAVPGSGRIRGIEILGSTVYAWRDNAGGTAQAIYKSSASGWTLVPFYRELVFTAGSGTPPAEAAVIVKGSSTTTVKRVVTRSGSWGAGTAAGVLIITNPTAEFTAGAFTAGITATCGGASTAITLLPGGRLDTVVYNFTGFAGRQRIYGADGVNKGWEFDGDVLVPIATGMAADTPTHVTAHRNHLFFSFAGSVQHSAIGDPYTWSAVLGAAEIAAGDVITGFQVLPSGSEGGALMILSERRTWMLYGSSSLNWQFVNFADDVGAQRWSIQNLGRVVVFDTLGIATVEASQNFGNFARLPLSAKIQRMLKSRTTLASVANRATARMRIFFSSGDNISITAIPTRTGEALAFMPFNYGKPVYVTADAVINGEHRNFFGSDDGYIYEADRGRSFDGNEIFAYLKLAFNHAKSPSEKKRFRRADIESKTESACAIRVVGEYSLGNPDIGLTEVVDVERLGVGAYFELTNFDESFFDTPRSAVSKVRLDGVGNDLSVSIISQASNELPHTLQSISTVYSPRRLDR